MTKNQRWGLGLMILFMGTANLVAILPNRPYFLIGLLVFFTCICGGMLTEDN